MLEDQEPGSLVMVIAAATAVCGVSAAIATAAAVGARKEGRADARRRHVAGLHRLDDGADASRRSVRSLGMDPIVGAAWIGGTLDATGRGRRRRRRCSGEQAEQIAAIVKMIQNILIGLVAFLDRSLLGDPGWSREGATATRRARNRRPWRSGTGSRNSFSASSRHRSSSRFVLTPTLGGGRVGEVLDA